MNDFEIPQSIFNNVFGSVAGSEVAINRSPKNKVINLNEIVDVVFKRRRRFILAIVYVIVSIFLSFAAIGYLKYSLIAIASLTGCCSLICFIAALYFIKGHYLITIKTMKQNKISIKVESVFYNEGKVFSEEINNRLKMLKNK